MPLYNVSVLFYNPNIEPHAEYLKRKDEFVKFLHKASLISDVTMLDCEYDNAAYTNAALSLRKDPEGCIDLQFKAEDARGTTQERCKMCFELRLTETARRAKTGEYDLFATTLSVSPHKNAKLLNDIGSTIAVEYDIDYLQADFKKKNGFKRSVELSKKYDLYRQDYCGCRVNFVDTKDS